MQKGDVLILKEWDGEKYTGRETSRRIEYERISDYDKQREGIYSL